MWLILLLMLLGTVISSQQQEQKQRPPESEAQQRPIPVLESQRRSLLELQPQSQEKRQQRQPQEGGEQPQQRLPPSPPQEEDAEQQISGEREEARQVQLPSQEEHAWKIIQKQQGQEQQGEEMAALMQENLLKEAEQAGSEPLPVDLPSIQERQQPQEKQEEGYPVTKIQQQEDGGQNLQYSSSGQRLPDLSSQNGQHTMEPREEKQLRTQNNQQHQHQQQQLQNADEQERQHHQELHAQEEILHQQLQELEEEEETEAPLPSNLPSLRWGEKAQLFKCCPHDSALVHHPGGDPPACEVVPLDQRWRPLLLNGRSGQRTPPDARSALVSGNVSCSGQHFWLNSADGDEFELLTTGYLYLRRSDALMEPLSFCADRLLIYPAEGDGAGPPRAARVARVCTVSMNEISSLLDEEALMPTCARRTCLRKCCPKGLKMRLPDQLCLPQTSPRPWQPSFWMKDGPAPDYHTIAGNPPCRTPDGGYRKVYSLQPAVRDDDAFLLREDGKLWIPRENANIELKDFCVDQVRSRECPSGSPFARASHHSARFRGWPCQDVSQ